MVSAEQTIRELKAIGSTLGVPNYGRMTKATLIEAINSHLQESEEVVEQVIEEAVIPTLDKLPDSFYVGVWTISVVLKAMFIVFLFTAVGVGYLMYQSGKAGYRIGKWYRPKFDASISQLRGIWRQYRTQ